jgi:hypothetical protein
MGLRFQGAQWMGADLPVPRGVSVSAFCLLRNPLGGTVISFRSLHKGYHRLYVGRDPEGHLYVRAATCTGLGTLREHTGYVTLSMGEPSAEEWVPVAVVWGRDGVRLTVAGREVSELGAGTIFALERVSVGRLDGFVPRDYLRADAAHPGVWVEHGLNRREVMALCDGYAPGVVHSGGLIDTLPWFRTGEGTPLTVDGPPFREVTVVTVSPPKPKNPAPVAARRPR